MKMDVIAQSEAMPLGMQGALPLIPTPGTFFHEALVM